MGIFGIILLVLAAWFCIWCVIGCFVFVVGYVFAVLYAALVEGQYPHACWHSGLED